MNTVTTSGSNKVITITLLQSELKERIQRESAWIARTFSKDTETFDALTITEAENTWMIQSIKDSLRKLQVSLTPYCTSCIENDPYTIVLTISSSFDSLLSHAIEANVTDAICKTILTLWYKDANILKSLTEDITGHVASITAILFQWRVNRTATFDPTEHTEELDDVNILSIQVALSNISTDILNDVNASLKSKIGTSEQYHNKKIADSDQFMLIRDIKSGATKIAEAIGSYVTYFNKSDTQLWWMISTSKSARPILSSSVADRISDALNGYAASKYLQSIDEDKLATHYFNRWEQSIKELEEELYKWRIIRTPTQKSFTLIKEETESIMLYLFIPRECE